jgi:xanthine/CO dehydrogenase XdhC/CoxF family maturation factor
MPYGSGCGGVVFVLLERRTTAAPLLTALEAAFQAREPLAIATVLDGARIGHRVFAGPAIQNGRIEQSSVDPIKAALGNLAVLALERMQSNDQRVEFEEGETRIWVDYRAARPGLWIFGAGDDAKPLLHLARQLGWFAGVADGRSHLATQARFPDADSVLTFASATLPKSGSTFLAGLKATDAVVLLTHSFEQDSRILAALLSGDFMPAYLGVLGPQRRTREVLAESARLLGFSNLTDPVEQWLARMHAPTGLDLGAETPTAIALSIIAEIQQTLNNGSALPLRQVRAVHPLMSHT